MNPPSHHRAVALALVVATAFALARTLGARGTASSPVSPDAPDAPGAWAGSLDAGAGDAGPAPVNPNVADRAALERVPGIGPALAGRILEARARGIRFRGASDLARVRGIGPRTAARLSPYWAFPDAGPTR